jgi:hypothetical protein
MNGTRRLSILGQVVLAGMFLAGVTVPTTAEAQDSCSGLINLQYVFTAWRATRIGSRCPWGPERSRAGRR